MRGRRKVINSNFSAGELDPRLVPMRSDVQAWQQGCKRMINMRPLLHGGAITRPGTDYCAVIGEDAVLWPFEFSESQGYVIMAINGAMHIFYDDGTFAVSIPTPFTVAQAREMRIAQSGDTMILCHRSIPTHQLTRTGSATFAISVFVFDSIAASGHTHQPFYRYAPSDVQVQIDGVSGSVTVTATDIVFTGAHLATYMRIEGKQLYITAILHGAAVTASIVETPTIAAGVNTYDWDEQAFSAAHGYPGAVCFHNERLVFGGSLHRPSGIWASCVGEFYNFDQGDASDSKAIWMGVAADKVVQVLHLASFKHLSVFTDQTELFQPESDTQPWSPKTAAIKNQTGYGCHSSVRPARFDEALIFVQRHGKQVREFLYDTASQAYSGDALSVMNPSRINQPISLAACTASRDVPEQYAYVVMQSGGMAVLHSLRAQRITAWAWWEAGGGGRYRQVCAVNGNVFVVVERGGIFYLEKLAYNHALDAATGVAVVAGGTTVSGLANLEGHRARAVHNGYPMSEGLVAGGVYQLADAVWSGPAPRAIVGLPFSTTLESMPPEIQVEDGSSRGRPVRVVRAGVQVHESIRFVLETEGINITSIDTPPADPVVPKSGMYDFALLGFDKGRTVTVRCDVPVPLTVLGFALEVVA